MMPTPMTRRRAILALGVSSGLLSGVARGDVAALPALASADLNGRAVALPREMPADRTIVVMTFAREHTAVRNLWADVLLQTSRGPASYLDLAVFDDYGRIFRGIVIEELRKQLTYETVRARVVPVFGGKADLIRAVGATSERDVLAMVVQRGSGAIIARYAGEPTPAALASLRSVAGLG